MNRVDHTLYECDICGCYHRWLFNGDCRNDSERFESIDAFADELNITAWDVELMSMDDRVLADQER